MGLLNLFEQTDRKNDSPLTELLDESSGETSNEDMVSKSKGMKGIYLMRSLVTILFSCCNETYFISVYIY